MYGIQGKRILIVSPEAWGEMRLSKHHYASELARLGACVYFLGPPKSSTKRVTVDAAGQDGLQVVSEPTWPRGSRWLPRPLRACIDAHRLKHIAQACGGPFDLLWNFDAFRFRSLRDRRNAALRILHLMDLHRSQTAVEPARHADLVVAVSPGMLKGLGHTAQRTLHVPHGVMLHAGTEPHASPLPGGPHLGYLGNLAMHALDTDALLRIARENPQATLHLFGPWEGAFGDPTPLAPAVLEAFRTMPNVRLHGAIPSRDIVARLSGMDLLLIAYKPRHGAVIANAHKVLEYLLTGRAVLSTHLADLQDLHGLIEMAPPGTSIADELPGVLEHLNELNVPEVMARRMAHAKCMTYEHHIHTILQRLDQLPLTNAR